MEGRLRGHRLFALAGVVFALSAGPGLAAEDPHVAAVAHDLEAPVQVRGRPAERMDVGQALALRHTPAVSIAVVDHGRIVWARAWGLADVASHAPATTQTVFQAGSISKPVAASAALQLVQEGRLDLDAPVNSALKSWRVPPGQFTASRPVTLRELLTYTAGLTVHGFPGYAAGAPVPTVVQVLEGEPPANTAPVVVDAMPGTAWRYSGGGFTIAQLLMTDVTGEAFPDLLRRRVFVPLGMTSSTYEQPLPADRQDGASGYLGDGQPVAGRFHTYPEMAAAGLWTTPSDLARWVIALQQAYHGGSSALMRASTARDMLTPGLGDWGLGVEVAGQGAARRFQHGGDDWGFKADMVGYFEGGRGVVAMANGDGGMAVVEALIQAVGRAYGWAGLEARTIDETPLTEAQRGQLAGTYAKGFITVSSGGGKLWGRLRGGDRAELVPTGPDHLVSLDNGYDVKVLRGPAAAVTGLEVGGQTFARDP